MHRYESDGGIQEEQKGLYTPTKKKQKQKAITVSQFHLNYCIAFLHRQSQLAYYQSVFTSHLHKYSHSTAAQKHSGKATLTFTLEPSPNVTCIFYRQPFTPITALNQRGAFWLKVTLTRQTFSSWLSGTERELWLLAPKHRPHIFTVLNRIWMQIKPLQSDGSMKKKKRAFHFCNYCGDLRVKWIYANWILRINVSVHYVCCVQIIVTLHEKWRWGEASRLVLKL